MYHSKIFLKYLNNAINNYSYITLFQARNCPFSKLQMKTPNELKIHKLNRLQAVLPVSNFQIFFLGYGNNKNNKNNNNIGSLTTMGKLKWR